MPADHRPGADATFDVVVVGGGPAGSAAAVTLARDGRSVLVVDSGRAERSFRIGEGAPPGLDGAVDQVFGAGAFAADDHLPSYANRAVWGSDRPVDTDFMFNPFGIGWHLDRVAFDARLRSVAETAGVVVWDGTVRSGAAGQGSASVGHDPAGAWHHGRLWTLAIETAAGGREVDASLVCDATGRRAAFARRHGGRLVAHDRLVAAVAVYDATAPPPAALVPPGPDAAVLSDDLDSATTIEAVEGGWWYTAAIPHRRRVAAFFTDGDLLDPELRTTAGFDRHVGATHVVGAAVHGSAPSYALGAPPVVTAAGTTHLARPSGPGWLATGDAAACFDPLSSQGILTAVLMGRTAGDAAISLLVDPRAGTDAYDARYRTIVDRYLEEQRTTYALERRWPDAAFWARRRGISSSER